MAFDAQRPQEVLINHLTTSRSALMLTNHWPRKRSAAGEHVCHSSDVLGELTDTSYDDDPLEEEQSQGAALGLLSVEDVRRSDGITAEESSVCAIENTATEASITSMPSALKMRIITGGYLWAREGDDDSVSWMERGLYSGAPCTYVYTPDGLTADSIMQALVAGRSFVTNGPLLRISIADHGPGESVSAGQSATQRLMITADDVRGLKRLDIVIDGVTVEQVDLSGELSVKQILEISLGAGQWCLVEAVGADGGYAFTNPIHITE